MKKLLGTSAVIRASNRGSSRKCSPPAKLKVKFKYWDWTLDAANIEASPLFDGSPYCMSGNSKAIPGRADISNSVKLPPVNIEFYFPVGTGGGCVTTGPFANAEVPFGPVTQA